ncbi:MAG: HD domain-containing protein [Armatimonadota bacterium]|nr:HD domain-containing protein [Armatimonadota bacterium]MDR7428006.1 HD domain-containing protein [Armatimonadota bacterium]MDR7465245.1 HD domain-containing protein [Armatimonadota bacterium]MDR7470780.1 HD domain-containing protein [Armatimonadota bacterium]MDR7475643.1 HD domain-containing protein [Armatimonadota bacterium]
MPPEDPAPLSGAAHPAATVLWSPPPGMRRARPQRPGQILSALSRARRTSLLFGPDHPVVLETMSEAHTLISHLLAQRASLRFFIDGDAFFVENTVLLEESLQLQPLLAELRAREIGAIELHAGLVPAELRSLVELLGLPPAEIHRRGGPTTTLQQLGVRHIVVGPSGPPRQDLDLRVDPREAYRAGLQVVDELTFQASRDVPLDLRKARLILTSLMDIIARNREALLGVSAIKDYDEDTAHHSVNVSVLSLLVGSQLELDRVGLTTLGLAALLHDIGKVRVPWEILTKASKLTQEELQVVRRHTLYGAQILRELPGLARLAMVVAFEHHANYDLSGYPAITAKPAPHLLTRIVQVADFYDAATSARRVYQRAMLPHEAITFILARAGKVFDPVVARIFVQQEGLYPVGSVVELDSGEVGVVIAPAEREVARPVVSLVRGRGGKPLPAVVVNLLEERKRRIARALDPLDAGVDCVAALQERAVSCEVSPTYL